MPTPMQKLAASFDKDMDIRRLASSDTYDSNDDSDDATLVVRKVRGRQSQYGSMQDATAKGFVPKSKGVTSPLPSNLDTEVNKAAAEMETITIKTQVGYNSNLQHPSAFKSPLSPQKLQQEESLPATNVEPQPEPSKESPTERQQPNRPVVELEPQMSPIILPRPGNLQVPSIPAVQPKQIIYSIHPPKPATDQQTPPPGHASLASPGMASSVPTSPTESHQKQVRPVRVNSSATGYDAAYTGEDHAGSLSHHPSRHGSFTNTGSNNTNTVSRRSSFVSQNSGEAEFNNRIETFSIDDMPTPRGYENSQPHTPLPQQYTPPHTQPGAYPDFAGESPHIGHTTHKVTRIAVNSSAPSTNPHQLTSPANSFHSSSTYSGITSYESNSVGTGGGRGNVAGVSAMAAAATRSSINNGPYEHPNSNTSNNRALSSALPPQPPQRENIRAASPDRKKNDRLRAKVLANMSESDQIRIALLLSTQDDKHGINMFDSLVPADHIELEHFLSRGYKHEQALTAIFKRKFESQSGSSNSTGRPRSPTSRRGSNASNIGSGYDAGTDYSPPPTSSVRRPSYSRSNSATGSMDDDNRSIHSQPQQPVNGGFYIMQSNPMYQPPAAVSNNAYVDDDNDERSRASAQTDYYSTTGGRSTSGYNNGPQSVSSPVSASRQLVPNRTSSMSPGPSFHLPPAPNDHYQDHNNSGYYQQQASPQYAHHDYENGSAGGRGSGNRSRRDTSPFSRLDTGSVNGNSTHRTHNNNNYNNQYSGGDGGSVGGDWNAGPVQTKTLHRKTHSNSSISTTNSRPQAGYQNNSDVETFSVDHNNTNGYNNSNGYNSARNQLRSSNSVASEQSQPASLPSKVTNRRDFALVAQQQAAEEEYYQQMKRQQQQSSSSSVGRSSEGAARYDNDERYYQHSPQAAAGNSHHNHHNGGAQHHDRRVAATTVDVPYYMQDYQRAQQANHNSPPPRAMPPVHPSSTFSNQYNATSNGNYYAPGMHSSGNSVVSSGGGGGDRRVGAQRQGSQTQFNYFDR